MSMKIVLGSINVKEKKKINNIFLIWLSLSTKPLFFFFFKFKLVANNIDNSKGFIFLNKIKYFSSAFTESLFF